MNKPDLSRVVKKVQRGVVKHSPGILTGLGIASMVGSTVLAVTATPKVLDLIEAEKEEKEVDKLTPLETVKVAWKPYAPAIVSAIFGTACLIGANSVHVRRNAALATAYKISETALHEYRAKVVETIGEEKERDIRDKVNKDKIKKQPVSKSEVIIATQGDTLCYDSLSGRYFKSDIETIKRAANELSYRMLNEMYISLNEFYDELDLEHTGVGDELGWNIDGGKIDIYFSSQIAEDGRPCIVIDFDTPPKYGYNKLS